MASWVTFQQRYLYSLVVFKDIHQGTRVWIRSHTGHRRAGATGRMSAHLLTDLLLGSLLTMLSEIARLVCIVRMITIHKNPNIDQLLRVVIFSFCVVLLLECQLGIVRVILVCCWFQLAEIMRSF